MSAQCSHPACVTCGRPSRRPESSTQSADQCGGGRRRPETRSTAIRTRYSRRSPAGQSMPSRARAVACSAFFADLVRLSGQQHTPGGHRVRRPRRQRVRWGPPRSTSCQDLFERRCRVEDRVVHEQYGKLLGELHTDATSGARGSGCSTRRFRPPRVLCWSRFPPRSACKGSHVCTSMFVICRWPRSSYVTEFSEAR